MPELQVRRVDAGPVIDSFCLDPKALLIRHLPAAGGFWLWERTTDGLPLKTTQFCRKPAVRTGFGCGGSKKPHTLSRLKPIQDGPPISPKCSA